MRARMLFFVGIILLVLALAGLLVSTRSFHKQTLVASVPGEYLLPPVAASATSKPLYHQLRYGETLSSIGRLYGVNPYAIARANGIPNPNRIYAGQWLLIPTEIQAPSVTPTTLLTVTLSPTSTPTQTLTPFWTSPVPTPLPQIVVKAEWPREMYLKSSDSVRISLVQTMDQVVAPPIETPGHTVIVAGPIPVGTLETLAQGTFGPGYRTSVVATLAATTFEVKLATVEEQSLEQPQIMWEWNISPQEPGSQQIVNVNIDVKWEPIEDEGKPIQYTIWRHGLQIPVKRSWMTTGQLNAFSLISALIGSVLSAPWLYERIKERREKRQKDEEGKPKILLP
jgi:LysM repeat protein